MGVAPTCCYCGEEGDLEKTEGTLQFQTVDCTVGYLVAEKNLVLDRTEATADVLRFHMISGLMVVELALEFCTWKELVWLLAATPALRDDARVPFVLRRAAFAGSAGSMPATNGALKWLATRLTACGASFEVLKLSDGICRHTDDGAIAASTACGALHSLHFHSGGGRHATGSGLTQVGLLSVLRSSSGSLRRVVLHGPAVTDEALAEVSVGCRVLEALWVSCADGVTGDGLRRCLNACRKLLDLRLDGLSEVDEDEIAEALAAQPLRCAYIADCSAPFTLSLRPADVARWHCLLRLGIFFDPGRRGRLQRTGPAKYLHAEAAGAVGALSQLRALALANVWVGDVLLDSLAGDARPEGQQSSLRALSLEGAHGCSAAALQRLVKARSASGGGHLEELLVTVGPGCAIDDGMLADWAATGVVFVSLEGAAITRDAVRRSGLRALRVKACGDFGLPAHPVLAPPAGRQLGLSVAASASARQPQSTERLPRQQLPALRVLGPEQPLCYWWGKGLRYDELSWYGLEHLCDTEESASFRSHR